MKRPIVLVLALAVVAAVVVLVTALTGAEPVRLSREGITVQVDRPGTGTVTAQVEVPPEVKAVAMHATMPQMGHLTPEVVATREKPGVFRATGELFAMTGRWELTVRADETVVKFEITVK
ncbi:FixH family protein [Kibdelosporangium persicum]|uniref:YtkA domain-containing protein n=1 Tax=Kibdelosporangium persicum TaxID=2698649 RepID=A0ABX2F7X3_9PSEU|nr:FixH family protein [Kibdelosporangium persicum]NRN66900.1 YtkA domain-containing protein [Kibdelosporangium persicum]